MSLTLRETLQRYAVVRTELSWPAGLQLLETHDHWAGLVVDLDRAHLPAERLFARLARLPSTFRTLALATNPDACIVEPCQRVGVELLAKPVSPEALRAFVCRGLVESVIPSPRLSAAVESLVKRCRLTPRELQLVVHGLADENRADIARRLGVTPNTLKSQVRGLLRKCGARSMDRLVTDLLREALSIPGKDLSSFVQGVASRPAVSSAEVACLSPVPAPEWSGALAG